VNVVVAAAGLLQYPLVAYSTRAGSYDVANVILLALPLPLFIAGRVFRRAPEAPRRRPGEKTALVASKSAPAISGV